MIISVVCPQPVHAVEVGDIMHCLMGASSAVSAVRLVLRSVVSTMRSLVRSVPESKAGRLVDEPYTPSEMRELREERCEAVTGTCTSTGSGGAEAVLDGLQVSDQATAGCSLTLGYKHRAILELSVYCNSHLRGRLAGWWRLRKCLCRPRLWGPSCSQPGRSPCWADWPSSRTRLQEDSDVTRSVACHSPVQEAPEGSDMQEVRGGRRSQSAWSHLPVSTPGSWVTSPHTARHGLELGELKQSMTLLRSLRRPSNNILVSTKLCTVRYTVGIIKMRSAQSYPVISMMNQ